MSIETWKIISSGVLLGLVAGISPGPLLTLVIGESLKEGRQSGIRMAFVPLVSDLPIVLLSLFILSHVNAYQQYLGIISMAGSLFLLVLVYENLFYSEKAGKNVKTTHRSFWKGVIANILSPHPYIFWILIGGTLVFKAASVSILLAILFVALFYLCLIGSKVTIAILTYRFSTIIQNRWYIYTIRMLGIVLLAFAVYFFIEGVHYIM